MPHLVVRRRWRLCLALAVFDGITWDPSTSAGNYIRYEVFSFSIVAHGRGTASQPSNQLTVTLPGMPTW